MEKIYKIPFIKWRRFISILILAMLSLFFLGPPSVCAYARETRTVRVGCIDIENFLIIDSDGNASGYAAEYLDKISNYTGWKYEYIRGTWAECLELLKDGQIDLLMPAEYTDERSQDYLFSDDYCCMDYAALIGRKDQDEFYYEDFTNFDGMTVGIIAKNFLNQVFDEYAKSNHFSVHKKEYPNSGQLVKALENNEVDGIINGNMNYYGTQKLLAKIDYMPAYFIASVRDSGLMEELNHAQHQIHLENPYYVADLHRKYYGEIERQAVGFTRQEADFMKNSGELRVLCRSGNAPLSLVSPDGSTAQGIYPAILDIIANQNGLKFRYKTYSSISQAQQMIRDGEADILLDTMEDITSAEQNGMKLTDTYYEMPYAVLATHMVSLNQPTMRAILPEAEQNAAEWLQKKYPGWDIILCKDWNTCIQAVKKDQADILLVSTAARQSLPEFRNELQLMNIAMASIHIPVSMAVSSQREDPLLPVLNKLILKADAPEIENRILNSLFVPQPLSFEDFVRQYPFQTLICCVFACIFIALFIALIYIYRLKSRQNKVLAEKNAQLEEAQRIEDDLTRRMRIDKLTGLLDKITIESGCRQHLALGGTGAMVVLDIDNFKEINDRHGHQQGDYVLASIGCLLQQFCRPDEFAGRIGGDEFMLFLRGWDGREQLTDRLSELDSSIRRLSTPASGAISCSIGAVMAPQDGTGYDTLFAAADRAMYTAKRNHKANPPVQTNQTGL